MNEGPKVGLAAFMPTPREPKGLTDDDLRVIMNQATLAVRAGCKIITAPPETLELLARLELERREKARASKGPITFHTTQY